MKKAAAIPVINIYFFVPGTISFSCLIALSQNINVLNTFFERKMQSSKLWIVVHALLSYENLYAWTTCNPIQNTRGVLNKNHNSNASKIKQTVQLKNKSTKSNKHTRSPLLIFCCCCCCPFNSYGRKREKFQLVRGSTVSGYHLAIKPTSLHANIDFICSVSVRGHITTLAIILFFFVPFVHSFFLSSTLPSSAQTLHFSLHLAFPHFVVLFALGN